MPLVKHNLRMSVLKKRNSYTLSFRPHLHVSGYPCKRILLNAFTQTIYTKMPKTYSECGYFVNGYLRGYSINAYIDRFDRFRVNKL